MAERWYPRLHHAETLWQEGHSHEARIALFSITQDMNAKGWARLESLQMLVRWGLKEDTMALARAMLAEPLAENNQKIRLEVGQILAELGQVREASALLLAHLRCWMPVRCESVLDTLAALGCIEEIARLAHDVNAYPGVRLAAASSLIRSGRIEEGIGILRHLADLTAKTTHPVGISESVRWSAVHTLSRFPDQRQLVEEVTAELAHNAQYVKVRVLAVEKLREQRQVEVLLHLGADRSAPPNIRKLVAASLLELGHTREAEALAREIGPT